MPMSALVILTFSAFLQYTAMALGMMAGKASYAAFATLGEDIKAAITAAIGSDEHTTALNLLFAGAWSYAALKATIALEKSWGGKDLIEDKAMD